MFRDLASWPWVSPSSRRLLLMTSPVFRCSMSVTFSCFRMFHMRCMLLLSGVSNAKPVPVIRCSKCEGCFWYRVFQMQSLFLLSGVPNAKATFAIECFKCKACSCYQVFHIRGLLLFRGCIFVVFCFAEG